MFTAIQLYLKHDPILTQTYNKILCKLVLLISQLTTYNVDPILTKGLPNNNQEMASYLSYYDILGMLQSH